MVLLIRILKVVLILVCVALMVIILMQEGKNAGLSGGIAGGNTETYVSKHRADTPEGKMERYTKILVAVFFILALALNVLAN